jgi:hypothetical protein
VAIPEERPVVETRAVMTRPAVEKPVAVRPAVMTGLEAETLAAERPVAVMSRLASETPVAMMSPVVMSRLAAETPVARPAAETLVEVMLPLGAGIPAVRRGEER